MKIKVKYYAAYECERAVARIVIDGEPYAIHEAIRLANEILEKAAKAQIETTYGPKGMYEAMIARQDRVNK